MELLHQLASTVLHAGNHVTLQAYVLAVTIVPPHRVEAVMDAMLSFAGP